MRRALQLLCFTLYQVYLSAFPLWAANYTWNSGNARWAESGRWTPNGIPGANDTAYVNNGGTVDVDASMNIGTLYLGQNAGHSGMIRIHGTSVTVNNAGGTFYIGNSGTGVMEVSNGAKVNAASFYVAQLANSRGEVTVTGAGSSISASTNFIIGGAGHGIVNVIDGGLVAYNGTTGNSALLIGNNASTGSGTLNLYRATVTASQIRLGATGAHGTVNLFGSGSSITVSRGNTGGSYNGSAGSLLETNWYVDSTDAGVSTIYAYGGPSANIDMTGTHNITAMGFAFQTFDNTFTIYTSFNSQNYSGTFVSTEALMPKLRVVTPGTNGEYILGFDPNKQFSVWDVTSEVIFTPVDDNSKKAWIKLTGKTDLTLLAIFDFEAEPTTEMLTAFVDFLNQGLAGTGTSYTVLQVKENQVCLALSDFESVLDQGYDVLGWGLECFNTQQGNMNNILLNHLRLSNLEEGGGGLEFFGGGEHHVPEPSTWAMILLGAVMIFRKKILSLRRGGKNR